MKPSIITRIKQALTVSEVESLLSELAQFKHASNKTINRAKREADRRIAELD